MELPGEYLLLLNFKKLWLYLSIRSWTGILSKRAKGAKRDIDDWISLATRP